MFGLPEIAVSTLALAPSAGADPRAPIEAVAALGVRGVVIDVSSPGLRPRELGRSARRDLAAILRRRELELAGLDLFIPPEHLTQPATAQRAIDAACQALEMAGELAPLVGGRSRPLVSALLPADLPEGTRQSLAQCAQGHGATLADHALMREESTPTPGIGVGVDPVFYLTDGRSPGKAVTRAGAELASARLCDTSAMGRCVVGAQGGKLDLTGYAGALIVSGQPWVTLDVRGLPEPLIGATKAIEAWRDAGAL